MRISLLVAVVFASAGCPHLVVLHEGSVADGGVSDPAEPTAACTPCVSNGDCCCATASTTCKPAPTSCDAPPPATPPPPSTCGSLVAPDSTAQCSACSGSSCQANGCYGGYWCDGATNKCHAPPSSCDSTP